jgi:hypothetical protein
MSLGMSDNEIFDEASKLTKCRIIYWDHIWSRWDDPRTCAAGKGGQCRMSKYMSQKMALSLTFPSAFAESVSMFSTSRCEVDALS